MERLASKGDPCWLTKLVKMSQNVSSLQGNMLRFPGKQFCHFTFIVITGGFKIVLGKVEIEKIRTGLGQFIGSMNYYRGLMGIRYTDGVKYLADRCGAYWFLDLIASYQRKLKDMYFQLWGIDVKEDNTATVTCREDSNRLPVVTQNIEYTDFPFDFELYCINRVILLKSEY